MNIVTLLVFLLFTANTRASDSAVVQHLRSSFQKAKAASNADLQSPRIWECKSLWISSNRTFPTKLVFLPFDGLMQVSGQRQSPSGRWDGVMNNHLVGKMVSMTRSAEMVMQVFNYNVWSPYIPAYIDLTFAFRVRSNGDLIVEYSTRPISGNFDLERLPPSLVLSDYLASEYWLCPK